MENRNPISPHIQVYEWHISSLVSISHRITGVINILFITLICFWVGSLFFGETEYELIQKILLSSFGKFLIISIIWSFSFQILSEIRHLFWDMGLGFELSTSQKSGWAVVALTFVFTLLIWILAYSVKATYE